jgi:2-keto-4-pentenoate hydratase
VVLQQDGTTVASGRGLAALGDPLRCVAWLAGALAEHGERLEAGDIVLSGALHAAVSARQGSTFAARFDDIGTVTVSFARAGNGQVGGQQ